jgi:hypothetical protein
MVRNKRKRNIVKLPNKPSSEEIGKLYRYLDTIYYNTKSGGGYSSPSKLHYELKRRNKYKNVGIGRIKKYLSQQNAYTLYRPAVNRFKTPYVKVNFMLEQFDMDLMDVHRTSEENDGVKFVLVAIDVLSKFAFGIPLKSKKVLEVTAGAIKIFDKRQPKSVCTDRGKEFSGAFQDMLKSRKIRHFFAQGSTHCAVVERFIRTLRGKIARYCYRKNSDRYIDELQNLVSNYNHSFHRSIKLRPIDVTVNNDHIANDNLRKGQKKNREKGFQFRVGDSVRISGTKHPFRREFFQRWSEEIFKISKRYKKDNINMYKIIDCSGEEIKGSFYFDELKAVDPTGQTYRIEKILDEKKENGVVYAKVQWENFPKTCAEWVLKSSIETLK